MTKLNFRRKENVSCKVKQIKRCVKGHIHPWKFQAFTFVKRDENIKQSLSSEENSEIPRLSKIFAVARESFLIFGSARESGFSAPVGNRETLSDHSPNYQFSNTVNREVFKKVRFARDEVSEINR